MYRFLFLIDSLVPVVFELRDYLYYSAESPGLWSELHLLMHNGLCWPLCVEDIAEGKCLVSTI